MKSKFDYFEEKFFNYISGVLKIITKEQKIDKKGDQYTSTELLVIPGGQGDTQATTLPDLIEGAFKEAKRKTIKKYKTTTLEQEHLGELLECLDEGQLKKFWMIFRDADKEISRIPKGKIKGAIQICERTLK